MEASIWLKSSTVILLLRCTISTKLDPSLTTPWVLYAAQVQRTMDGWKLYFSQPILPASISYIMLFFNAVLSPGGLMTAFLASRGLSGTAAAIFRCACNSLLVLSEIYVFGPLSHCGQLSLARLEMAMYFNCVF